MIQMKYHALFRIVWVLDIFDTLSEGNYVKREIEKKQVKTFEIKYMYEKKE